MKTLCIFSGSSPSALDRYRAVIDRLIETLAQGGHGVVFGGVDLGMMGYLARQARRQDLRVTGVVPAFFLEDGLRLVPDIEQVVVGGMVERLEEMCRRSDAFICLPGGYGTFEELFQILSMQQLGRLRQPCGLLNVGGFFDSLLAQIDEAEGAGFIRSEHVSMLISEQSPSRLLARLEEIELPTVMKWREFEDVE